MCYNASLTKPAEVLQDRFKKRMLRKEQMTLPLVNVSAFARPWWPVITAEAPDAIQPLQWGLIPPFGKSDPKAFLAKTPTFNSVSEEAHNRASFRDAWTKGRRCLIPVTSFREWQHRDVPGRKTPKKVPYDIAVPSETIFCLGGLYTDDTYTILTRPANTLMAEIHNKKQRMPVIIALALEGDWLSPHLNEEDIKRFLGAAADVPLAATEALKEGELF